MATFLNTSANSLKLEKFKFRKKLVYFSIKFRPLRSTRSIDRKGKKRRIRVWKFSFLFKLAAGFPLREIWLNVNFSLISLKIAGNFATNRPLFIALLNPLDYRNRDSWLARFWWKLAGVHQPLTFPRPNSERIGRFRKLGSVKGWKNCVALTEVESDPVTSEIERIPPLPPRRLCSPLGRRRWETMIAHVTRASHPAPLSQHFPHCLKKGKNKMKLSLEVVQPIQPAL